MADQVPGDDPWEAFEAVKRASVSQLLLKAGRLVDERGVARLSAPGGGPRLRRSHTALFPHLDREGTRISTLAERVGVTKQAISQLVGDLEALGVLQRVPDPTDGRAKLVVFAEEGPAVLMRGMQLLGEIDAELTEALGEERMTRVRGDLQRVIEALEAEE